MTTSFCWDRRGRAREPRPAGWSRTAAWSSFRPATCCARPARPRAPRWASASPTVMARGDLVTDEIVIGLIAEQLDARRPAAASSSTASRARWPQADALERAAGGQGQDPRRGDRDAGRRRGARRPHHRALHLRQLRRGLPRHRPSPTASGRRLRQLRLDRTSSAAPMTTPTALRLRLMAYYRRPRR